MNNFVPVYWKLRQNEFHINDLPKLIQEEIESLNILRIIIFTKKKTRTGGFKGNFYQAFREQMITILLNVFLPIEKEEIFQTHVIRIVWPCNKIINRYCGSLKKKVYAHSLILKMGFDKPHQEVGFISPLWYSLLETVLISHGRWQKWCYASCGPSF